jgi:subtilisin family serine protease
MRRPSLILALAVLGAASGVPRASALPDDSGEAAVAESTDAEPTATFCVRAPERRADVARMTRRVERRLGAARLLEVRRVLGRRGIDVVCVFAVPKLAKPGGKAKPGRRAGAETLRKRAKAKPVNLPILESDWNRAAVSSQEAMVRTSAQAAWGRATGHGQVVALLDGGFDLGHEALAGRLAAAAPYDALDDDFDAQDLGDGVDQDRDGVVDRVACHGTFVASLVLAAAPGARVLPVRVLDDEGWGTDLALAAGLTYAVEHGADVVNMSLVLPNASPTLRNAVRAAEDAGVVVVSASGTTDDGWQNDPYLASHACIVGAVDRTDTCPAWTDASPAVAVFAPGVDVVGALGRKAGAGWSASSYGRWSGTSFSTAFVSAGAALLRERHPADWSIVDVRRRLTTSVDPAYAASGALMNRRGRIDFGQAVAGY